MARDWDLRRRKIRGQAPRGQVRLLHGLAVRTSAATTIAPSPHLPSAQRQQDRRRRCADDCVCGSADVPRTRLVGCKHKRPTCTLRWRSQCQPFDGWVAPALGPQAMCVCHILRSLVAFDCGVRFAALGTPPPPFLAVGAMPQPIVLD